MPRITNELIPNSIRHYRRRAHLRLFEVAQYVGLSSPAHLAHWERGRKVPTLDNLLKLAAVLKVPVEVLYFDRSQLMRQHVKQRQTLPLKKPL